MKKIILPITLIFLGLAFFHSPVFKEVAAGVAILLFGMLMLEKGFNSFVEGPLQIWLKKLTNKLYKSLGLGFFVTALLQSSSLISVITISFISAGLIQLQAGIGIIFGSNLGTTATAWLVSIFGLKIDVAAIAMPMLVFGIILVMQAKESLKGAGNILAGLGFFFLGIYYMKNGFDSYQDSINLASYALPGFKGLLVYTVIGVFITLVLQSSSAAMALILTALAAGQITYENSLALAIGSNVGTTITAILGALGTNVAGKRLAGAHLIFNVITGIATLALIVPLGNLVDEVSLWLGVATDNHTIKLSIFHTIFNLLGLLLMLPLISVLVRLLTRWIKDKVDVKDRIEMPKYLVESVLKQPQAALLALSNESKRLFEKGAFNIVSYGLNLNPGEIESDKKLSSIVRESNSAYEFDVELIYYRKVKTIYSEILKYAVLTESEHKLSKENSEKLLKIKLANRKIVEIIKSVKGVRDNINIYSVSKNEYIKEEYNSLRNNVLKVLRAMYKLKNPDNREINLDKLLEMKHRAIESDKLIDGTLQRLLKANKIDGSMTTSLVNDSNTAVEISIKMIEIIELLYIDYDSLVNSEDT